MTPLCEIADRFLCDKFMPHQYTPVYYRLLAGRIEQVSKLLEVGIGKGRSLRMWEQFFPNARIYGIDIQPDYMVNAGRITSFVGNQNNKKSMSTIAKSIGGKFDVIIDDANHNAGPQIKAMTALLPFLAKDGIFFIEDIREDMDAIIEHVPSTFHYEIYEGAKKLPSGASERMLILREKSA